MTKPVATEQNGHRARGYPAVA
jgi:hypothetical protein